MEEIRRDGEQVEIRATREELRLIVGAINESLNGAYAIPSDEWGALVGQPAENADALLDTLVAMIER